MFNFICPFNRGSVRDWNITASFFAVSAIFAKLKWALESAATTSDISCLNNFKCGIDTLTGLLNMVLARISSTYFASKKCWSNAKFTG